LRFHPELIFFNNQSLYIEAMQQKKQQNFSVSEGWVLPKAKKSDAREKLRWLREDNLTTWTNKALEYIAERFQALQVSLYISRKRENSEKEYLQLVGCWGNILTNMKMVVQAGEGLLGQAYKTKRSFYIDSANASNYFIETSIAQIKVQSIVIYPLVYDNKVEGVLEFNTGVRLEPAEMEILQDLGAGLAIQLQAYKTQEAIERLYEEANDKNLLLRAQEDELRKNLAELKATQQAMQVIQDNLEATVKNRTQELIETLENLKAAQEQMILNEKLATLGQLVAGVAHEINTPIAAIKAGIENMMDYIPSLVNKMPELLANATIEMRTLFRNLINECINESKTLTNKEERALRKRYETELQALQLTEARYFASLLVSNGFRGELGPFHQLFLDTNAKEFLQIASNIINLNSNINIMNQATDKTRKIVYSLKNFAHFQTEEELREINVNDSIEDILTLYQNQLKKGIEVVRQYGSVSPILGYADQIGQIWTNIIYNAIQAMNFMGKITISTYNVAEGIEVAIQDNGPGIPIAIQNKIFDPFFTTKPKGEGTGMGLDIVKKIIQKHNGSIRLESEPGNTTFYVTFPAAK
jgi:signal transduction histidine kinase